MRMNQLTNEEKSLIAKMLSEDLQAYTVILFGSAAKETMRDDSDVDISFLSDEIFSPYTLFIKAQELADKLGREVDLVDFQEASTVFKAQIVGTGKLLLDNQPVNRQYAFMRSLKSYAILNDERKDILKNLGYEGGLTIDRRRDHQQNGEHQTLYSENP
jgi:predicted nucleotidyltransferase